MTDEVRTSRFRGTKRQLDYQTNVRLTTPQLAESEHTLTFALDHERDGALAKSAFTDIDRSFETLSVIGQYQLGLFSRVFLAVGSATTTTISSRTPPLIV